MNAGHEIHRNADGGEMWLTCDGQEFARITKSEILNFDLSQRGLEKHINGLLEEHKQKEHGWPNNPEQFKES